MADIGCEVTMKVLNDFFSSPKVYNDTHDVFARLSAGEALVNVVVDLAKDSYGANSTRLKAVERIFGNWPQAHLDFVRAMVLLALSHIDDDENRIHITWKGDADHPETVTRFELRDNELLIEFAHPAAALRLTA